jgi:predicted nuclease of predicted toxin-antitoxin system
MRVVIDASIDPRLVEAFPDHQVQTLSISAGNI